MPSKETVCIGDAIEISNDLECGNADFIHPVAEGRAEIGPRDDGIPHEMQVKGPISCYNVCVRLKNTTGRPQRVTLDIVIPQWLIEAGFGHFLRKEYFVRSVDDLSWQEVPARDATSLPDRMRFEIELGANEERVFSSVPHYPYSHCVERLRALAAAHAEAKLVETGRSVQGRSVWALEIGDGKRRPRVLVTATLQPGEPAAWAVMAMAEWLLDSPSRGDILSRFGIDFVPEPNPDGNVMGLCNVNGEGEIAHFGFRDAAEGRDCPAETRNLWDYLSASPPLGYMDFHTLHAPNHPVPMVIFCESSAHADPVRRALAERTAKHVAAASGHKLIDDRPVDHPLLGGIAVCQATKRHGSVSYVEQFTGPQATLAALKRRGPAALAAFVECLAAEV